jgi:hypothetical protein
MRMYDIVKYVCECTIIIKSQYKEGRESVKLSIQLYTEFDTLPSRVLIIDSCYYECNILCHIYSLIND